MWLKGKCSFDLCELSSAQVKGANRPVVLKKLGKKGFVKRHSVQATPWQFAVAIARASTTRSEAIPLGYFRALAAYGNLQANVTAVGGRVHANHGLLSLLRDSERTGWSAAVAQGFCWLVAMEHFGCSAVVDFAAGCTLLNPPVVAPKLNEERPDFIGWDAKVAELSLFESKGGTAITADKVKWKSGLREALGQLAAGRTRLHPQHGAKLKREIAVCLAWVEGSPAVGAFADPEREPEGEGSSQVKLAMLRTHFAAWAGSLGAFDAADRLFAGARVPSRPVDLSDGLVAVLDRRDGLGVPEFLLDGRGFALPGWPYIGPGSVAPVLPVVDRTVWQGVIRGDIDQALGGLAAASARVADRRIRTEGSESSAADWYLADGTAYVEF
ncbi:MAG TPA: hypothetical protein PKA64_06335 [Myxococcota bacterium]|nr:hypothetical protein [Myxococcota bacterium]